MPQMMPINWIFSFIFFICIFIIFMIMNYYIFNYKPNNNTTQTKSFKNIKFLYWKW